MENIYIINWDRSHLVDVDYDAFHVPFKDSGYLGADILDDYEFEHPNIILYLGDYDVLGKIDYLINDTNTPLFSKKLIKTLESLGEFLHRTIPCGIVDYTIGSKKAFKSYKDGILNPVTEVNEDYQILHLLEHLDILDKDKSDIIMSKIDPHEISLITKIVLKEPEGGFPPIFRITDDFGPMFIPEYTKKALDAAGIQGILYEKIEIGVKK